MNQPFTVCGRHAVLEALKSEDSFEKLFLLQSPHRSDALKQIRSMAQQSGIPVLFVPREKLEKLAGNQDHQGVVGILSSHAYATLSDILQRKKENRLILVLDHLEDPHNLGSLLRTCDAVGACGVVIPKRRAAGLTTGAAKSAAGAASHVPVARVSNLHQTLLMLREEGYTLIGSHQSASQPYHAISYPEPLALVLGNEHQGLSLLLKNTCDHLVRIPMQGHLDSLNVSVAGALLLYQILLQWQEGIHHGKKNL